LNITLFYFYHLFCFFWARSPKNNRQKKKSTMRGSPQCLKGSRMTTEPGVLFAPQSHTALQRGIDRLADLVRPTRGPTPRCVAIATALPDHPPEILDDAATIVRRIIQIPNPYVDMGAMLLRHTLWKTHEAVGDGTATTAVLFQGLLRRAAPYIAAGGNPLALKRGLERGLAVALAALKQQSQPLEGATAISRAAEMLCHDTELAKLLGEIFDITGADGYVQLESGHTRGLERQYVEGAHWETGYCSPYFVTDENKQEARLEDPAILISDLRITAAEQLIPLLERLALAERRSLLIIAREVSGSALGLLVANHQAGTMRLLAVQAPGMATQQISILEDLAIQTGGRVITTAAGTRAETITLEDLGSSRVAWANATTFGLIGGKGDPISLRQRITQIKAAVAAASEVEERQNARERMGKLIGGVAILRIGGATKIDLETRKEQAGRAITALRLAMDGGVAPGGGAAYMACQSALCNLPVSFDEQVGIHALSAALEEPLRAIAYNAGYEPATIVAQVKGRCAGYGLDARTGAIVDMAEAGIVDPVQVLQAALTAAVSGVIMALTTSFLVNGQRPILMGRP
jgi:chaperonin GroEL